MVSKPSIPEVRYPDPLPPPPERSEVETEALKEDQRRRGPRQGRAATLLTGGLGSDSPASANRFLTSGV